MTVRLPAWLQSGAYTAELDRMVGTGLLTPASALGARGGVRRWSGNEFQVVPTAPASMQVAIKPGMAWIQGTYTPTQGAYVTVNDADVNLTISGAHATLSRIDLIVLEVLDQTYSGTNNFAQLRVVTGTAATTPAAPAVTGSYIILAQVRVSPAVTSIATSAITDTRPFIAAAGGTIPVRNAADRLAMTNLPAGTDVLELDTGRVYQASYGVAGGWIYAYGGTPPLTWTVPTLLNGWSLYYNTGTIWRGPRYRLTMSGQVEIQGIARAGSFGASIFRLPAGYRPALRLIFTSWGGEPNMPVRLDIDNDGDISVENSTSRFSFHATNWVSLNLTFTPDQ